MAAAIDSSLVSDHSPWSHRAYNILGEMASRGNTIAGMVKRELKLLDDQLNQLATKNRQVVSQPPNNLPADDHATGASEAVEEMYPLAPENSIFDVFGLEDCFSAEQLVHVADSLDIGVLSWPYPEEPLQTG